MKIILFAALLLGMFIPALASAEFNYNSIDIGYSTTSYLNRDPELTELDAGFSKSISKNVYLGISYGAGSQPIIKTSAKNSGNNKVDSISAGAGYHTPLKVDIDAIVEGHITQGSAKQGGNRASANGYDISAGARTLFMRGLEGSLKLIHASTSNGRYSSSDTYLKAQFGYNFTPWLQMTAGIDFKPDQTSVIGIRYYY